MEQTGHGATLQEAQWPIRDTVIPAIAAGTPPDVVHDMGKMSGALYIEGAYLTLNDLVDAAPFSPDDFIAADIDSLTFFGDIKKIPFWHNTVPIAVLAYRKDFVDEAGLSQPRNRGRLGYLRRPLGLGRQAPGPGRQRQHHPFSAGTTSA